MAGARIPVVDLFAGPGGLGEGFSAVDDPNGNTAFDVVLSIEMDPHAFETLTLRAFFRQFSDGAPDAYYRSLRKEIDLDTLYSTHPKEATEAARRCWRARLGPSGVSAVEVRDRIDGVIDRDKAWVLIGGPPCQAYSLAGRSRNSGNLDYDPEADERQRLYVEYLQILADHRPTVFIMENVKGLLSATLKNERIFGRILEDLSHPTEALAREGRETRGARSSGYRIYSLVDGREFVDGNVEGAVINAEDYGVPQCRHRVILLGVRDDVDAVPGILEKRPEVTVNDVIGPLPQLRSGLSKGIDTTDEWLRCLRSQLKNHWLKDGKKNSVSEELSREIRTVLSGLERIPDGRGGEFIPGDVASLHESEWYCDERIGGVCNHTTRGHIEEDLYRYLFASCYARLYGKSPDLHEFPDDLLPDHASAWKAIRLGGHFSDRFRVQVAGRPSTTIMSHISRDGHYYIHPDPGQCRSLTVREAARLQTFPDNYLFCGARTAQYVQVGNAVPPFLAKQVGQIVHGILIGKSGTE